MPRETTWRILRSASPAPLLAVDRFAAEANLTARDRGLVRRMVGTEIRRRGTLRAVVRQFARGKPKADLLAHLHVGLVQLLFLDGVPPHAAVSETVRATANTLGLAKARYMNGVLRTVQRALLNELTGDARRDIVGRGLSFEEPIFKDPEEHPLLWAEDALSMPANLMKRWIKRYGQEAAFELGRAAMGEPDMSLRVVGIERAELEKELAALDLSTRPAEHPDVLVIDPGHAEQVIGSESFKAGRFTIQGETALRAAEFLQAQAGERLLDMCAAPGGKTMVLAGSGASVVATDRSPQRLARMASNLERLKVPGKVQCVATDGVGGLNEGKFDGVLVDVPCSNTGVLSARPNARWRFGPRSQGDLTTLQARLLQEAATRVRSGGRLVYSTCSLESEENGRQIRAFLEANPGWTLEEERENTPAAPGGAGPIDGGYAARLRAT
ncbi:MAG: 16S rRNA (cytosine967-C5)-methyltransferase [Chlamydiales bacterium]|jgi:16S rRNA (cytosine967-C5)-methyltransferase